MTDTQRHQLLLLQRAMEDRAVPVGPMHAWWDAIFDIRCVLSGERKPMWPATVEERIADAEATLTKWGHKLPY